MQRYLHTALAIIALPATLAAQITGNPNTRTLGIDYTASSPTSTALSSQQLSGTIATDALAGVVGTNPVTLIFQLALTGRDATGVSNPFFLSATGTQDHGVLNVAYLNAGFFAGDMNGSYQQDFTQGWAEDYLQFLGDNPYNAFETGPRRMVILPGTVIPYQLSMGGFADPADFGPDASVHIVGSIALTGVTAYDAAGQQIGTAAFDANGNGTFGTVPEPSSLALLGTGLVSLIPIARRRHRA